MSVVRTSYASTHSLSPRHIQTWKDATTSIIIIDDVVTGGIVGVHTEVDRQVVWLKFTPDFGYSVLDEAPEGITAFSPAHEDLSKTRLYAQASEIFVIKYTTSAKTTQSEVTGYAMEPSDAVFVKIDIQADTATIYQ